MSIARVTPAQNPRGCAKNIFSGTYALTGISMVLPHHFLANVVLSKPVPGPASCGWSLSMDWPNKGL